MNRYIVDIHISYPDREIVWKDVWVSCEESDTFLAELMTAREAKGVLRTGGIYTVIIKEVVKT